MVTPIGAVLTAETGDTTRSPGHEGFFPFSHRVTTVFLRRLVILWRAGLQHSTRDYTAVIHCGHGVTAEFRWTQIVAPVSVVSTVPPLAEGG